MERCLMCQKVHLDRHIDYFVVEINEESFAAPVCSSCAELHEQSVIVNKILESLGIEGAELEEIDE